MYTVYLNAEQVKKFTKNEQKSQKIRASLDGGMLAKLHTETRKSNRLYFYSFDVEPPRSSQSSTICMHVYDSIMDANPHLIIMERSFMLNEVE